MSLLSSFNNRILKSKLIESNQCIYYLNKCYFSPSFGMPLNGNERPIAYYCKNKGNLALRRIDASQAKELFCNEKHRLPKDLTIVDNNINSDNSNEIVLSFNKLNQESSISFYLENIYDNDNNEMQTHIKEIDRSFCDAHKPIECSIESSLNTYVARLQRCIDKDGKKYL